MPTLTMGSLFAGIGGFEEAGRRNGIETLWNCEIDPFKRQILYKNFPHVHQYADIRDAHNPPYVDILTGGFPCQDISIAQNNKGGAQGITGERSGLWKEYARLLGEIRPKSVVFENSAMLLVRGFEHVLCDFSRLGYDVEWRCFYATQWGYPHNRERLYGIAYARGERFQEIVRQGGILQKVAPRRQTRSYPDSLPLKRFNRESDFTGVRMVDGFRQGLDPRRIHGLGNAVVVDIPQAIFKVLLEHWPHS